MTQKQIEKFRNICWKNALVNEINYKYICATLDEIESECEAIRTYSHEDLDELADALGSEEEAEEFSMQFALLSNDAELLRNDLYDYDVEENFDGFFVAVKGGGQGGGLSYYDDFCGDYFGLENYETRVAEEESRKRLLRLKKAEIIDTAIRCFRIFTAFQSVHRRYQDLKIAIDILKDKHNGFVQMTREVNELFEKADSENFFGDNTRKFDKVVAELPEFAWLV